MKIKPSASLSGSGAHEEEVEVSLRSMMAVLSEFQVSSFKFQVGDFGSAR
jgi:hypothetical protein